MTRKFLPVSRRGPRRSPSSWTRRDGQAEWQNWATQYESRVGELRPSARGAVARQDRNHWDLQATSWGGRVALRKLNLDGDGQADLTVHGGDAKAVYCYPL